MEIRNADYSVVYDEATATVTCTGSFRLNGTDEYAPIVQVLNTALDKQPETITLNLQDLQFLNSSGINVLSKFVISVRQKGKTQMIVKGSKRIPWQSKSLINLQRLMPTLKLELDD
jgi:anti-anti-sigma factor